MSGSNPRRTGQGKLAGEGKSAALKLAEEVQRHPFAAAAIAGGAAALAGGAFVGARALARRNGASEGKPVNQVLQNAITASECKGRRGE